MLKCSEEKTDYNLVMFSQKFFDNDTVKCSYNILGGLKKYIHCKKKFRLDRVDPRVDHCDPCVDHFDSFFYY